MLTTLGQTPVMYWRRTFHGSADQVRTVRALVALLLAGFPPLDDVLLVADELVVNALRHTRSGDDGGEFAVEVFQDAGGVTVSISDGGGPDEPTVKNAGDLDESGRGLHTVAALASSWSWSGDADGRTVSAFFAGGHQ